MTDSSLPRRPKKYIGLLELHIFANASTRAYTIVIYIPVLGFEKIGSYLLCSKTHIIKLNAFSITKLELLVVILASCTAKFVRTAIPVLLQRQIVLPDSRSVLA